MAKRRKKPSRTFREPVPGELERDDESWSGLKVAAACVGMLGVLAVGTLIWKGLYFAGIAGVIGPVIYAIYKYFRTDQ